ncbi:TOMM precursor leader peptide-binding protein [Streptomyces sp. SL13]|uniref:TOMM leader peptide-binding protein n=1 Tax=Streptantibioticus silvisoli TaxID=2705255 RepID=A0AA90H7W1_9ACTN|nr:TOMM precursor leader peptide-binding protein [Streptantibioticus silvisoli]MDI5973536.1 TOMM precursor leader peptide-binding protein [Streptantibioticus silvisoli]
MDLPRFKAHLVPQIVGPDRVFLVSEEGHYLVQGKAVAEVALLLDGTHTIAEMAEKLSDRFTLGEVVFAVSKFQRFRHLAEGPIGTDRAAVAFWEAQGVDAGEAARRLDEARVEITSVGAVDEAEAVAALRTTGTEVLPVTAAAVGVTGPALAVVLADDYCNPQLAVVDARLRAAGIPWLLAKPNGADVWTGPYMVPGATGCWRCLTQRLEGNRQVEAYLRRKRGDGTSPPASLAVAPWSGGLSAQMVAGAVAGIIGAQASPYQGVLVSVHVPTTRTERHQLVRQPQCPGCGDPSVLRTGPRIELTGQAVRFSADGGHRTMRPDETYKRLEKHVSRLTGAVSSLRLLNDADNGVTYSYAAGHNFAMPGDNLTMLRRNLRGQSGGKGRTDIQARVSGMCEAIERYSGVWRNDRPTHRARFDAFGPDRAVHPNDLLQYSESQYANREEWNRDSAGRLHIVPEPFDTGREIDWTAAWSLTHERERLVPSGYAWFGHPDLEDHFYCFSDGNGNAAGNTLEEAILQAFYELCERDAVGLWWYNRALRPGFELDSLREPYTDTLREFYAGMNRSLEVVDLTTDLGIPTFAAVSRRVDHPVEDVLLGFGAHLDVRIAVLRALTEVNQFLPAVINRTADGATDYWEDDPDTLAWLQQVTVAQEPWVVPAAHLPATSAGHYDGLFSGDLAEDIRNGVGRADRAGLEVIVLDQSLPDLELKVAKVMVPGLRHFWRRLGPGRLFTVPVDLGWVSAPTAENRLNPRSVFF